MSAMGRSPLRPGEVDLRADPLMVNLPQREVDVRADPLLLNLPAREAGRAPQRHGDATTARLAGGLYTTMSPWSMLLTGVYLPCYIFVLILTLFTFSYHRFPVAPWFTVVLCLDGVIVGMWPSAQRWTGKCRWDWFPLLSGLLAIGVAVLLGLINYSSMEMWVHSKRLPAYNNLSPDTDPTSVSDAGIIRFAAGTTLDTSMSAGFQAWPYMYCAAPVLTSSGVGGADADTPPIVGFWAVGVNCCSSEGGFWCDGAQDTQARSGLRMQGHWAARLAGHDAEKYFTKAAMKAAATEGLQVADSHVFLMWSRHPETAAVLSWWVAVSVWGVFVVIALGTCYGCRTLFQSFLKSRNFCK